MDSCKQLLFSAQGSPPLYLSKRNHYFPRVVFTCSLASRQATALHQIVPALRPPPFLRERWYLFTSLVQASRQWHHHRAQSCIKKIPLLGFPAHPLRKPETSVMMLHLTMARNSLVIFVYGILTCNFRITLVGVC